MIGMQWNTVFLSLINRHIFYAAKEALRRINVHLLVEHSCIQVDSNAKIYSFINVFIYPPECFSTFSLVV